MVIRMERQIVRIGAATIAFETAGTGRPIVLIHGLAGSSRWWRYTIPVLAKHFRIYAVNVIGFGGSRGSAHFALNDAAEILGIWMRQWMATPVTLVGHSMGGLIAADLAATAPELVERLVLVNAAAVPIGRRYLSHAWGLAGVARYARVSLLPVLLTDSLRAGPRTMLRATWQVLNADISPRLGMIQAPTLVVWGEYNKLLPLAMGRRLQSAIPGAQLAVIAEAGHNPMWERPADFNTVVLNFVQY